MISQHAIDNCLDRVMKIDPEKASDYQREQARDKIQRALDMPDTIIQETDDDSPIYINGDVAIPVKTDGERVVPTAYHTKVFQGNNESAR